MMQAGLAERGLKTRVAIGAAAFALALAVVAAWATQRQIDAWLDATDARFVAKFDDDDHYGPEYLTDALLVHRFVDAAIVGKKTFYAHLEGPDETILRFPGNEFTFANRVSGSTLVIDRALMPDVRFSALNLGEDNDLFERALARGLGVFSADRYNYVAARRPDRDSHSWSIDGPGRTAASCRPWSIRLASPSTAWTMPQQVSSSPRRT